MLLTAILLTTPAIAVDREDDPFIAANAAYKAAETDPARLEIALDFLADHPQHKRAPYMTYRAVTILRGPAFDDDARAIAVARKQTDLASDETREDLENIVFSLYAHPDYKAELAAYVDEVFDYDSMTFGEHVFVLDAAVSAEAWSLVDRHVAGATPLASPEAYRADHADRDLSDEIIAAAGRHRLGLLKTYSGWAASRRGIFDVAVRDFAEARGLVRETRFGLPENDLLRYWGQTQVELGDIDSGLEKLALAGLFGGDEEAAGLAHRTFLDLGRSQSEYDRFLWRKRSEHGVPMTDFTAVDYADTPRSFRDLQGRKATLLAFWFPT